MLFNLQLKQLNKQEVYNAAVSLVLMYMGDQQQNPWHTP